MHWPNNYAETDCHRTIGPPGSEMELVHCSWAFMQIFHGISQLGMDIAMWPWVYDWLMRVVVSVQAEFPRWHQLAICCCMQQPVPLFAVEDALTVTVDGVCLLPSPVLCEWLVWWSSLRTCQIARIHQHHSFCTLRTMQHCQRGIGLFLVWHNDEWTNQIGVVHLC